MGNEQTYWTIHGGPTYQGTALRLNVVEASPLDLGDRPPIFEAVLLGWTTKEIKEKARKELEEFKKVSKDEPDHLVSGDMGKIIRGEDDGD